MPQKTAVSHGGVGQPPARQLRLWKGSHKKQNPPLTAGQVSHLQGNSPTDRLALIQKNVNGGLIYFKTTIARVSVSPQHLRQQNITAIHRTAYAS